MQFYKNIVLTIVLILLFPVLSHADETITGHACYTYGDKENLTEARETARTLAIRNALESYRVFIESATKATNFALTNDKVRMLSSGYLKNITVLKHTEHGRTICDTIQASVNPMEIETFIKQEAAQRTQEGEEEEIDTNKCLKIVSAKETMCGESDAHYRCIRVVVKAIKPPEYCDHRLRTVFIEYFDKDGGPLDGASKEVLYKESGDIRAILFFGDNLPPDARSFHVRLKHFIFMEE